MEKTALTIDKLAKGKKESNEKLSLKSSNQKIQPENEENNDKQIVPDNPIADQAATT